MTSTTTTRAPRVEAPPRKTPRRRWKRALIWTLGLTAALAALSLGAFAVLYVTTDIPEPNDFATSETSIVYFADQQTELGRFSSENRVSVPIEQVPDHVQQAVLAAEDRTFYENSGVSLPGIVRAFWTNLTTGSTQGGSTITQQYVKNYYLTQDQTFVRKAREIILALKIDATVSKDQILEDYLNTVYFGRGSYGIETGAQAWFRTDVENLTVSQGAVLAAALQAPSGYDPANGSDAADALDERFGYVIDGMVEQGWLSAADAATQAVPEIAPPPTGNQLGGTNGYLLTMVRDELLSLGFSEQQIDSDGLRVQTTFDPQAQQAAVDAVAAESPTVDAEDVHVGVAAVEPGTGAVRAVYGGADYVQRPLNNASQAFIQGGSTFKAFTLGAALEDGISLSSRFSGNSPFEIPGDTSESRFVNNEFDQDYGSLVDLRYATEQSINTAFVDLTTTVGPAAVQDVAMRAGIPDTLPDGESNGLVPNARITLGIASVSALQMAEAYATIASEGIHATPFTVVSVRGLDGTVEYESAQTVERVLDSDVAADITAAMRGVVSNGTGRAALALGRPAAGKTGTAGADGVTGSSWFVGYTPQLAAAVGYFRGEGRPTDNLDGAGGLSTFFGGEYPARTWTTFMIGALEGQSVAQLPPAANLGEAVRPSPTVAPRASAPPQRTATPTPEAPPAPTPTPTPTPTPAPTPSPTPSPTPAPSPPAAPAAPAPAAPAPADPAPVAPGGGMAPSGGGTSGTGGAGQGAGAVAPAPAPAADEAPPG